MIDNYDRFWGMNYKLMQNDGVMARNLPIRIYLPESCPVIQEPVSPIDDRGKPHITKYTAN
jgi:autophagy-related protein 5